MSLRRFFKKARQRASFEPESQPQETTTVTTEGPTGSSVPVLPPPAESGQHAPPPVSPRRIRYLNIIRQYFPLPRRRNSELAGRHVGLEFGPQMRELDSCQSSLDAVMPYFELAGRHGGLGFRPQMREYIGGLLERYLQHRTNRERYLQHRANRQLNNEIASRQDRNNRADIEQHVSQHEHGSTISQACPSQNDDIEGRQLHHEFLTRIDTMLADRAARRSQADVEHDNTQYSYEPAIPMDFPLQNTEAQRAQLDLAVMREFNVVFARHEASNSQANVDNHDPPNAHGYTMFQTFPSQNDEIEGHGLLLPTPRMQIRAVSPVPSRSSNIPYYSITDNYNNKLQGTENSDDGPSSEHGSQVRRGRSLRRSGSPFSDAFPVLQGSNHPSRDHSQVHRGRTLLRASSLVNDPWVALWGPIGQPNAQISQEPRGRTLRRASSLVSGSASDSVSQEPHVTLERGGDAGRRAGRYGDFDGVNDEQDGGAGGAPETGAVAGGSASGPGKLPGRGDSSESSNPQAGGGMEGRG